MQNRSAEQQRKQKADCGNMAMLKGWSCLGICTRATSGYAFRQRKGLLQTPTSVQQGAPWDSRLQDGNPNAVKAYQTLRALTSSSWDLIQK